MSAERTAKSFSRAIGASLPVLVFCVGLGCGGSVGASDAVGAGPASTAPPATPGDGKLADGGSSAPLSDASDASSAADGSDASDLDPMPENGGPLTFACPAGLREKRSGAVAIDQTWKKGVYEVDGVLTVTAALTLEAGVVICFATTVEDYLPQAGISVRTGGTIRALGTRSDRVVFTVFRPADTAPLTPDVRFDFVDADAAAGSILKWTDFYSGDTSPSVHWHVYGGPYQSAVSRLERVGIHRGTLIIGYGLTPSSRVGIYDPDENPNAWPASAAKLTYDAIVMTSTTSPPGLLALALGGGHESIAYSLTLERLRFPYSARRLAVRGPTAPVLTLRAGVKIVFAERGSLEVGLNPSRPGDLVTEGTAGDPVQLTCLRSAGAPSDSGCWEGVRFVGGPFPNTRIRGTILEGGGLPKMPACWQTGSLMSIITTPGIALPDIEGTTFIQVSAQSPSITACGISVVCGTKEGICPDAASYQAVAASNVFTAPGSALFPVTCANCFWPPKTIARAVSPRQLRRASTTCKS